MSLVSRRAFLKLGAVGGTALLLGVYCGTGGELVKGPADVWDDLPGAFQPNAWLRLNSDGSVLVCINHSEMGQGIITGLVMMVAEELEADWARVSVEIAPAEAVYKNPAFNVQMTGDSTSTRTSWDILRQAGATARHLLLQAAALDWSVPMAECRAEKEQVIYPPTGQKLDYGQLAARAAQLPIPDNVPLKSPQDFAIIGHSYPRLDTPAKCTGQAVFGLDVHVPELLTAVVVRPPAVGARLKTWDATEAMTPPGARQGVETDTGVAVVADTFWQARKAATRLQIEWTEGETALSSETVREQWLELARTQEGSSRHEVGNPKEALTGAAPRYSGRL